MKPLRNWQKVVIAIVIFLVFAGIAYFLYLRSYRLGNNNQPVENLPPSTTQPQENNNSQNPVTKSAYSYPIKGYSQRVTFRWFGKLVKPTDKVTPCGAPFSGYHDADDLEILSGEENTDVPVYAIADGTVREIGRVSGYGGLLVLDVNINNQPYTVYYGHISLSSSALRLGDVVKSGQKLANLGAACSNETDGERKHLHFAIHKGNSLDLRGYVPNTIVLSNWLNPKEFLTQLNANPI